MAADFRPFGWLHLLSVLLWLGAGTWVVLLGRSWRGSDRERRLRRAFGVLILISETGGQIWLNTGPRFDPLYGLPLQVCDLAVSCAWLALLTRLRWPRALLFFFGLGLSTQTFFTPTLRAGPASPEFWFFWTAHTEIATAAVYLMAVEGFRPTFRDYRFSVSAGVVYVAAMVPLDLFLGADYGYVGPSKPDTPTVLDALGPWPGRVFLIMGLTLALFTIMWRVGRRRRLA